MQRYLSYALLAFAITASAAACDDDDPTGPQPERFRATLNGANERPDPRTTPATGTADFSYLNDVLSWTVTLNGINNISGAHIHIGGANESGGILLPLGTTGASGTLTNAGFTGSIARTAFTPPAAPNSAITFDDLLQRMRNGTVYVNIHTSDPALAGNNTPGDFPSGEIRGQINPR